MFIYTRFYKRGCVTEEFRFFYDFDLQFSLEFYLILMFASLLSHLWLVYFFAYTCFLPTTYRPCQATCVQSHQSLPRAAVAIAIWERYEHLSPGKCSKFPTLIARLMWPTWGPPGADRTQVGPMLATWTLLSGQLQRNAASHWLDAYTERSLIMLWSYP